MRYAIRDGGPSILALIVSLLLSSALSAQESRPQLGNGAVVPRRVNFSGRTRDEHGKAIAGNVVVSFAIYRGQFDDRPLWMETQNVQADAEGHYRVQLGASEASGLPLDLFSSGEARWLGVRENGGTERSRVLLLSVPYALEAADAQTLGGLPPSAFLLATTPPSTVGAASTGTALSQPLAAALTAVTTAGGTAQALAKFTGTAAIANSLIFDDGTHVGIGNTAPGAKLDVSGAAIFRGALNLPATGAATATAGKKLSTSEFHCLCLQQRHLESCESNLPLASRAGGEQYDNCLGETEPAVRVRKRAGKDRALHLEQGHHQFRRGADLSGRGGKRDGEERGLERSGFRLQRERLSRHHQRHAELAVARSA